ncbi:hypothetical protein V502_11382 [Pseudogymnoascus sp. VKM F-4520 (FW-2644)]|nr:hypothetical protein V502_11382 [Pseudogymnoascus sp. VKM F-4520 (FW-2644)]
MVCLRDEIFPRKPFKNFFRCKKPHGDGDRPKIHSGDDEPHDSNSTASSNVSIRSRPPSLFRWSHQSTQSGYRSSTDEQQLVTQPNLSSNTEVQKPPTKDSHGLEVIYRPLGEHKFDIVFVDGLGGDNRETWKTWSKERNLDNFWPLKWLPSVAGINDARISMIGYDTNLMSYSDFGKDLLYNLKYASEESEQGQKYIGIGEKPIILIAHSMGGIILKAALQLNMISKAFDKKYPSEVIPYLASGPQALQGLNERFRHVAPNLRTASFYETRPTAITNLGKMMVLERESSVLGYPGEISKSLDADHRGVCKFDGPDDPNYVSVRNVIQSFIKSHKPNMTLAEEVQGSSVHNVSFDFEGYLSAPESPERGYKFFRDRWTPGTSDYQSLWLWLYQNSLITLSIKHPLFWVIDGVDEADNPESIIRLLSKLHLATIPIRVLVVSRPTHEISSSFQKLQKQVHSDKIYIEGNQEDFLSYISNEMDLAGEPSYREDIIRQILEKAHGNFLWVRFAVEKMNNCHTRPDVKGALNRLPLGMEGLYNRMANSIQTQPKANNQMLAKTILGCAACSHRSLSVEELRDALGKDSPLDIYRVVNDLCGGFVVIDNEDKVSMIHATAVEYLFQEDREGLQFVIDRKSANDKLFKSCILCLTDPKLRSQVNRNNPPVFLDYAFNFWFVHLEHGSATKTDVLMLLFKFLQGPHVLTWISIAAKRKQLRGLIDAPRRMVAVANMLSKLCIEDADAIEQHKAIELLTNWATDLVNIVGKFGSYLTKDPNSIYKLIAPFCP